MQLVIAHWVAETDCINQHIEFCFYIRVSLALYKQFNLSLQLTDESYLTLRLCFDPFNFISTDGSGYNKYQRQAQWYSANNDGQP